MLKDSDCLKKHFKWVAGGDGNCGCLTAGELRDPKRCTPHVTGTGFLPWYEIIGQPVEEDMSIDADWGVITYKILMPKSGLRPYKIKHGQIHTQARWMWLRDNSTDLLPNGCPADFPYISPFADYSNYCYNDLCTGFDLSLANPCAQPVGNPCDSWCSHDPYDVTSGCGTVCGGRAAASRSMLHYDTGQECLNAIMHERSCMKTYMKYNDDPSSMG